MTSLTTKFFTDGQPPRCPPNPAYPNGIDLDISEGKTPACWVKLPKVETVGQMLIRCQKCRQRVVISMAGRPDDARSMRMACKREGMQ